MDLSEKNFESDIEKYLLSEEGGYIKGSQLNYDKKKTLNMPDMVSFIRATQPKEWERYERTYLGEAEKMLYKRFEEEVDSKGLIFVLRNGIKDRGITIRFAYFAPSSMLNEDLVNKYNKNIMTCTRQFAYSADSANTIDTVLSINGIPIVAIELKNQFTGQSVEDGKLQYIHDRDVRELIFNFNKRLLVYFTADLYEVWMTTRLEKESTYFLPFNQGSRGAGEVGGSGNPLNSDGYPTAYFWEKVLQKDRLLEILQKFINVEVKNKEVTENGKKVKKETKKIIFPRYHQLDVVEKLMDHTYLNGSGHNYLIQHSAGSGKSNSIAWLTYRLSSLHDKDDRNIFDSVFVITDRRVLNKQLQDTVTGFEHKIGLIVTIKDETASTDLRDAINDGKKIIITTLHRFPIIYQEVDRHHGKRFAVIVDEAHSSQSGTSAKKLKEALADTEEALKEYAEITGKTEEEILDDEDILVREILSHGQHSNLSFFAFTATPKPKTLETFGTPQPDGMFRAFHIYSMRQAIEEGFILDVLKYYTTIENSYEVAKDIKDNPEMTELPTMMAIKKYQKGHEFVIAQKIEIIVEKFREVTLSKINSKAKAMVVTSSRAHAVKYFLAMKKYISEKAYIDINPLVAFSGKITIGETEHTESSLNSHGDFRISERQLPEYFASDAYNVLIVADKYQTGFDEPMLHTMFVDKKLHGVKAVQTLSRLNRTVKGKIDTYVLDFANNADDMQKSFQPFYEDTILSRKIDVNLVYKYKDKLDSFYLFSIEDVYKFCDLYLQTDKKTTAVHGKLASIIKFTTENYNKFTEEQRYEIRDTIRNFNRFYSYVVQIARMFDTELHKYYLFCEYLFRLIPKEPTEIIDINKKVKLVNNTLNETFSGSIEYDPKPIVNPEGDNKAKLTPKKKELLENIIEKINIMFEGKFTEGDRVIIETIYDRLIEHSKKLKKQAKNTDSEMFIQSIFPDEFDKIARGCYVEQMDAFSKLFENPDFYKKVMDQMAQVMYSSLRNKKDE